MMQSHISWAMPTLAYRKVLVSLGNFGRIQALRDKLRDFVQKSGGGGSVGYNRAAES